MLGDTIQAVASPPGASARGVIRVSGPSARRAAETVVVDAIPERRCAVDVRVRVGAHTVDALLLFMPGPRSFTGEDVVELHLPGAPLLLETVAASLPAVRRATPGEFTRRAFENGRLDLSQAEAVLDLIHASSVDEARSAMHAVQGGLAEAVDRCRASLQDVLAMLEAGLDFTAEETGAVDLDECLPGVVSARESIARLCAGLPPARPGGELLLVGVTNAGKSSLCNALAGTERVLVADRAGTTRDVIAVDIGDGVVVCDGPGDLDDAGAADVDRAALTLRAARASAAGAALLVVDPTAHGARLPESLGLPVAAVVLTHADLEPQPLVPPGVPDRVPVFTVSNVTGRGIDALRTWLLRAGRGGPATGRTHAREHLEAAAASLDGALAAAAMHRSAELLAFDLADALQQLDGVHGRSTPEAVLDRIFGRFCLGK